MSSFSSNYNLKYDNNSVNVYNKMSELNTLSEEIKDTSDQLGETTSIDIIGGYITQAYNSLRLGLKSINIFSSMVDSGVDQINAGQMGVVLKTYITSAIIIILIVGIVLAAIMKWRL